MNNRESLFEFRSFGEFKTRIFKLATYFFFFLMLVVPTAFQLQRGFLLVALVYLAMLGIVASWRVHQDVLLIATFIFLVGATFVFHGIVQATPGWSSMSTVYLIWPLVYMIFVGLAHEPVVIRSLEKVLLLGIFFSATILLIVLASAFLGFGPAVTELLAFIDAGYGFEEGAIGIRSYGMSTVIYGFPYLSALLFVSSDQAGSERRHILALWLMTLVVCIASGRRAFWLLVLVSPLIVIGLSTACGGGMRWKRISLVLSFAFGVVLLTVHYLGLDLTEMQQKAFAAFDRLSERSARLRFEQMSALLSGWQERPVLGQGLGASAELVRDPDMPWAYELSYVALLFHTGLIGVCFYTLAIGWIFWKGAWIARRDAEFRIAILPLLCGLAGFLLVNATNPYLAKFDYLWTVFLPIAAINMYLVRRSSECVSYVVSR
jgi:hypothetical protein